MSLICMKMNLKGKRKECGFARRLFLKQRQKVTEKWKWTFGALSKPEFQQNIRFPSGLSSIEIYSHSGSYYSHLVFTRWWNEQLRQIVNKNHKLDAVSHFTHPKFKSALPLDGRDGLHSQSSKRMQWLFLDHLISQRELSNQDIQQNSRYTHHEQHDQ